MTLSETMPGMGHCWKGEYKYSSAKFYHTGIDDFGFLSHYCG